MNLVTAGAWFYEHPCVRFVVSDKFAYYESLWIKKKKLLNALNVNVQTKSRRMPNKFVFLFQNVSITFHLTLALGERAVGHPGIKGKQE